MDKDAELMDKDAELMDKDAELMDKDAELMDKDAELMDKDMALMDKDAELMDKDMALMDKDMQLMDEDATIINNLNLKIEILSAAMQMDDSVCDNIPNADKVADTTLGQLCDQADVWIANYEALCNNVPLFGDAIGIVDTSVVAVLGASNTALGGVNSVINTLKGFSTGFSHNIPDINVDLGEIDLPLGIGEVSLGSINIPLPTITIPGITPFSFLPTIPLIPGSAVGVVDVTLDQVADCSII